MFLIKCQKLTTGLGRSVCGFCIVDTTEIVQKTRRVSLPMAKFPRSSALEPNQRRGNDTCRYRLGLGHTPDVLCQGLLTAALDKRMPARTTEETMRIGLSASCQQH